MSFDWIAFFDSYRVEYRDRGSNVGKDHVVVRCPWCGPSDTSGHMSVSLEGKGWRCFRNAAHAGGHPYRLVAELCGNPAKAHEITKTGKINTRDVRLSFLEQVRGKLSDQNHNETPEHPECEGLQSLATARVCDRPFVNYVRSRGFAVPALLDYYEVGFTKRGRLRGRIVFTVRDMNGKRVGYTGRAVTKQTQPRYLTEGDLSGVLLWGDRAPDYGSTLVLVEGPFDALKVNVLGAKEGVFATCALTSQFGSAQRGLLLDLMKRFERTVTLFDEGNETANLRLARELRGSIEIGHLPPYASDPGELRDLSCIQ